VISEEKIKSEFIKEMKDYEDKTMDRCELVRGKFQGKVKGKDPLKLAADWIGSDMKEPARDGFIKLLKCRKDKGFNAPKYSLEALYVKFEKKYREKYHHLFDKEVLKVAKSRIEKYIK